MQTIKVGIRTCIKKDTRVPESWPFVSDFTTKKTLYALCIGYCVRAHRKAKSSAVEKPNKQCAVIVFIIFLGANLFLRSI